MRQFCFFITLTFILTFSFPAQGQNWLWAKGAIGAGDACSICADGFGNVFVAGNFSSNITLGSVTLTNIGGGFENVFIAKYDANGNILWARNTGGDFTSQIHSVCTDATGNVIITGWFGCTTITFGSITLTNIGPSGSNYDVFIVKYDSNGNVLWAKSAGGTYSGCITEGNSVSADVNGEIYVTGNFSRSATFDGTTITNSGGYDVFIAKYDLNGNFIWVINSVGTGNGNGISTDGNGNVYIVGSFTEATITFGSTTLTNGSVPYRGDLFIVKYDANGTFLWAQKAGGSDWDQGFSITIDGKGNPYITGQTQSPTIQFGSITLNTLTPNSAMFIAKYDTNGNALWAKITGGAANSSVGWSIISDKGSNIYVTGSFFWNFVLIEHIVLYSPGGDALFLAKYDTLGNVLCASALENGSNNNYRDAVAADKFGNAYVAGGYSSNPFIVGTDTLVTTYRTVFVAKYSCDNFPANFSQTNLNCNGQCTGSATATPLGGISPYTYNWSNGKTTQTITGLCAGTYSLVISDANSNHTSMNVVAITEPPAITLTTSAINYCIGNFGGATVTASGGVPNYTYNWNTGQTSSIISGLTSGNYTVVVTDGNGCSNTTSVTINSLPTPTVSIAGNATICSGQSTTLYASGGTTYIWNTGSSGSSIIVSPATNTTYSVSVSNGYCSSNASIFINVNPPPNAVISGSTNLCSGQTTTLTASGGGTYLWNTGATASSVSVSPSASTTYSLTVTGANGCTATKTVTVTVTPNPVAIVSPNSTICAGSIVTLTASGAATYVWNTGATTPSIQVNPNTSANYSVVVANGNCKDTASTTVTVNPNPVATTSGNVTIFQGQSTTLSAGGGTTYLWDNGKTTTTVTVAPAVNTMYCVTVTTVSNCSDVACATVNVESPCDTVRSFFFPNAFSPNRDGENDLLKIYYGSIACIKSLHLVLYNRFGQMLFETSDAGFKWDGTFNGEQIQSSVLAYYLYVKFSDGKETNRKGNISLMR